MTRVLSAHQPAYLPWLGYFDKIARADVFVYLDTVQFEKNSFTNRNRILGANGPMWLTVPVRQKGHLGATLQTLEIDDSQPWRDKHLKSIALSYRKAPGFEQKFAKLQALYHEPGALLADHCWTQLKFWMNELRVETRVVRSSELPPMGRKSDLVLDLCRHFGADAYLSGKLGRDYLDESAFAADGIAVTYQDYRCAPYPQIHGSFVPALGIVDAWMNSEAPLSNLIAGVVQS
ncbi:WbqC family protein [Paraburkholderia bengalensis]|uniref:WbqC family protein n=1 Tax=Paraburkholderia bengalensis TaxID=2747562 RepID=A0ABU8J4N3_9BURK